MGDIDVQAKRLFNISEMITVFTNLLLEVAVIITVYTIYVRLV